MKHFLAVIFDETAKRRWRRIFKRRRREAIQLGQQADEKIESLLIRRFDRLVHVRRFMLMWVALFVVMLFAGVLQYRNLSAYYQELRPAAGGIYNEGTVGTFTNANPIYATGLTDLAVSRLVFSGLFKYDNNNSLVGDLAEKYDLNATQTRYTIYLKKNIKWHDGEKLTADDVAFTYKTIQNSEAQSPFYTTWQGITVTKHDEYTLHFDLPNSLGAFPHSLTNGILPQHILQKIPPSQLRSASFNTAPVGTGPFMWRFVNVSGSTVDSRQQHISLSAYKDYWQGQPKLDSFSIITFANQERLIEAFKKKQLNAISGLNTVPEELAGGKNVDVHPTPITGAVMAFFNNSRPPLGSPNIRKALVSSVDTSKVVSLLSYPVLKINSPLLPIHIGYDPGAVQLAYDPAAAAKLLEQEGWQKTADGPRVKDGQPLKLTLRSQDTPEYIKVSKFLQGEWAKAGINVAVHYHSNEDLQRTFIAGHDYDILLYGISIGVDPDVFAYWHSSQASISSAGRLNLSEYKSTTADQSLEAARTRSDPALRIPKYKSFLNAWRQDAPALALYQPNFIYVTNGPVFNYSRKSYNSGADRFYNVHEWMVRQERQTIRD